MTNPAIELRGLRKNFTSFNLGPLDLEVPKGTILGLIGQNGAGKSTTIKLILGLLGADGGRVSVLGEDPRNNPDLMERIGFVFDDLHLPQTMTVLEAGTFSFLAYRNWDQEKFASLVKDFGLPAKVRVKDLSRGMKMKLSLALALSHKAELLVLDEATSGLDPVVREEALDLLMDFIQDEDHTVLVSSHILSDLEKVSDYIAFIEGGQVLFMEEKEALKENYGICQLTDEEAHALDPAALVRRRKTALTQSFLVRRDLVPPGLEIDRPSIEDIMIYHVRGEEV